ncbi:peptide chain release factor N(5)-glutamine methyltransferase [Christiangramia portivictoriae]|uniref:peptide chain release factor N(5)-glutamine methyltransferase n=1 Tax=Christiangramia portivictoriae TaxID=326069 RepID=UPI0003FBFAD8|nr:peptide chain release factor N(5)-glutamine methyltransferase [Christiangramia portivictoriae]
MQLANFKKVFFEELSDFYPDTEVQSFYFMLTQQFLGKSRLELALEPECEILEEQRNQFQDALDRLKIHEPIQHILERSEFFGLTFKVSKEVLIPRPETEELVSWILEDFSSEEKLIRILDIGSGSGCIPISLAKNLSSAEVHSWDVSAEALKIAEFNAKFNNLGVNFQLKDILETKDLEQEFDVIVSNPPYVRNLEKKEMHANVLNHEPALALYVDDKDPLIFHRKISELAAKNLKVGGSLYFEINQYLGAETLEIVRRFGFEAGLKKDIFGNDRMLRAIKKNEGAL